MNDKSYDNLRWPKCCLNIFLKYNIPKIDETLLLGNGGLKSLNISTYLTSFLILGDGQI